MIKNSKENRKMGEGKGEIEKEGEKWTRERKKREGEIVK